MKQIPFSINSWIFGNVPIEKIAQRAKAIGVSSLDISGEPEKIDAIAVKNLLKKYNLTAICINGNFIEDSRAFNHSDPKLRANAIDYGKRCIDLANQIGTSKVLVVPSQVFKTSYFSSMQDDWNNSVSALQEVADYAMHHGKITIMLECVNKYEVSLVRTLDDGIKMAKDIGMENVKIIADTFHMHLEEQNGIHNAIRAAGNNWIAHLHVGDNTREVPGKGCINWREILLALRDIDYQGAISFEPLPHRLTPEQIFNGGLDPIELDKDLSFSLNYLTSIMHLIN
jgi:D-psicose/D-tagatose/L-ribulose 3-epimerase